MPTDSGAAWLVWRSPSGEVTIDAANERPGRRWLDSAWPGVPDAAGGCLAPETAGVSLQRIGRSGRFGEYLVQ
jgi:hypothetical protein